MTCSRTNQPRRVCCFAFPLVAVFVVYGASGDDVGHIPTPSAGAAGSSVIVVEAPSFARGPGQRIAVSSKTAGLPLRLLGSHDIHSVELRLDYNPALLAITRIEPIPGGTIRTKRIDAGSIHVRFEAMDDFDASEDAETPLTFAHLLGTVPDRAPYRAKNRLVITNVSVNDGHLEARGSKSTHLVAYPGDTTGNGSLSSLDASHVLRLSLGLDDRLPSFSRFGSQLVADVTGDGRIRRDDARHVLLEVVGLDSAHVPDLPGVLPPVFIVGPDPRVDIPTALSGPPGSTVEGPVNIDTALGLIAADIRLSYDTSILDVSDVDGFRRGSVMSDQNGLIIGNLQQEAGRLIVGIAVTTARDDISGAILEVDYEISEEAESGDTVLNLESVSLNENGLELNPVPREDPNDETDGRLTIEATGPLFVRGDVDSSGSVELTDGVFLFNFLFIGGPGPSCRAAADASQQGNVNLSSGVYILNFLFLGGPPPLAPYPDCGTNSVESDSILGCVSFPPCED